MATDCEIMQMALDALEWHERRSPQIYGPLKFQEEAIAALRARLADGERQEPVLANVWFHRMPDGDYDIHDSGNLPNRPDGCDVCVQAVVIRRDWHP